MTSTRYVIMANGSGTRWGDHLGVPKHLIEIGGETLLRRMVRQVAALQPDADIVISASDPAYETLGARRHMPLVNEVELDRFVPELMTENICYLYGDTYYSDAAIREVIETPADGMLFFGDEGGIVAVKSTDQRLLEHHFWRVRNLYLAGEIPSCIGWQLYQSFAGLEFGRGQIREHFVRMSQVARGFNTPGEYEDFVASLKYGQREIGHSSD